MKFLTVLLIFNIASTYLPTDIYLKKGIVYASAVYSLISITYKLFLPNLFPSEYTDNVFVQNWGHSYIADFLIFSVPLLIHNVTPKKIPVSTVLLIPITLAIILSNSRSSIVALIIGISFIKSEHLYHRLFKLLAITSLLVSLICIYFFSNHLKSPNGSRPEYWSQAISGFVNSPLVGIGSGNFGIINRLYRQNTVNSSSYTHNSILESLLENGIFFTIVTFGLTGYGLWYQYRHYRLFFVLGIISLTNSLLDPSWASPGILALTMIFIFWKINPKPAPRYFTAILAVTILIYLISKTISDILFVKAKYELSLKFDPFNPSSLTSLVDTKQPQIRYLYEQDPYFLNLLSDTKYLPQNESVFFESIRLDPFGSTNKISRLVYYYTNTNDFQKLKSTIPLVYTHIDPTVIPFNLSLELAKSIYKLGIHEWEQKNYQEAINHLQKAVTYSRKWSHFELELATALWQSGGSKKAFDSLTNCQKNTASAKHCYDFQLEIKKSGWPPVGSYAQTISSLQVPPID